VHHRLARPHRNPPERHRNAFGFERPLDEVVVPTEAPPVVTRNIGAQVPGAADAIRRGLEGVGGDAEIDGLGAFVTGQMPAARNRSNTRSVRGRGSRPAITNSSPVARMATLGRRRTARRG